MPDNRSEPLGAPSTDASKQAVEVKVSAMAGSDREPPEDRPKIDETKGVSSGSVVLASRRSGGVENAARNPAPI